MNIEILKVTANHQSDVLTVEAIDPYTGHPITVMGWVSAMTNYYPADCYDQDGNLVGDCESREMDDDEKRKYVYSLVEAVMEVPVEVAEEISEPVEEDLTDLFS